MSNTDDGGLSVTFADKNSKSLLTAVNPLDAGEATQIRS